MRKDSSMLVREVEYGWDYLAIGKRSARGVELPLNFPFFLHDRRRTHTGIRLEPQAKMALVQNQESPYLSEIRAVSFQGPGSGERNYYVHKGLLAEFETANDMCFDPLPSVMVFKKVTERVGQVWIKYSIHGLEELVRDQIMEIAGHWNSMTVLEIAKKTCASATGDDKWIHDLIKSHCHQALRQPAELGQESIREMLSPWDTISDILLAEFLLICEANADAPAGSTVGDDFRSMQTATRVEFRTSHFSEKSSSRGIFPESKVDTGPSAN
ncbi:uncharacterized protein B0I36DRAFT_356119 [Microdochium trichocladiopsis]|uniref:Uncharacterized protein n=1 Tax=Microdochium trichocladiopsis TaxID=1682393 RepID=A0A9P9BI52_9PEZI|nr:uncharacterized protein B0I36DRAFT_356119 [Microdochium trichocladiopsis]KAH7012760.1 hypothetical protein B0I36DRAFT_356119 [Microdochium trichocladiopsis]